MKEQIEEIKQIYEIAWDLCDIPKHPDIKSCEECKGCACHAKYYAERVYNAGYRKQKEGEWIWTENGEEDYEQYWVCSCCHEKSYWESKFCSDCGAKMKGGAE